MKKIVLIISLIIFNFLLIYSKINSTNIKDIQINLKKNEIGVVFLSLPNSKSLLIKKEDTNILYVLSYYNSELLDKTVNLFTDELDYIILNQDWDFSSEETILLNNQIDIKGISITKNRIIYDNHIFCINSSLNCTYSYYFESPIISNEKLDALFYEQELTVNSLADEWIDQYKIGDDYYTVMILSDQYEVITFLK